MAVRGGVLARGSGHAMCATTLVTAGRPCSMSVRELSELGRRSTMLQHGECIGSGLHQNEDRGLRAGGNVHEYSSARSLVCEVASVYDACA